MRKDSFYFPNLNGVRCIAALMVILSHVELNKSYFGLHNNFQGVKHLGKLGVTLFFVLSGFLITYLLLREKEKYGVINIKLFYLRRVLRIWPLYYLVILLSLFVLPNLSVFEIPNLHLEYDTNHQFFVVWFMFVFFIPNVLIYLKLIPFATQTWSIGTEEQFYLIWPILINRVSKLWKYFLSIIIGYNLVLIIVNCSFLDDVKYIGLIRNYLALIQLNALGLGALGAYFLFKKNRIIVFFTKMLVFIPVFFVLIIVIIFNVHLDYFNPLFNSILFVIVILNLVSNKRILKLLENDVFIYLGKISYGLYMYHQMMIVLCINILQKWNIMNDFLLYILSIISTILVAGLSYQFIEKPFLNKKNSLLTLNINSSPIL